MIRPEDLVEIRNVNARTEGWVGSSGWRSIVRVVVQLVGLIYTVYTPGGLNRQTDIVLKSDADL
jgi:hypothetical protein